MVNIPVYYPTYCKHIIYGFYNDKKNIYLYIEISYDIVYYYPGIVYSMYIIYVTGMSTSLIYESG